ncbi:MAG: hypothetical protein IJN42_02575 [Clostridia bacterium]|nr:hypothetical protein [Clostridia bacterium]
MTIEQAYQRSYEQKDRATLKKLAATQTALHHKKKRLQTAGEEEMRRAYAQYMQSAAMKSQQNRAKGRHGGAGDNAVAGLKQTHRNRQDQKLFEMKQQREAADQEMAESVSSAQNTLEDNARAMQLIRDKEQIKAEQAAAKAAAKATKTTTKSSSKKSTAKQTNAKSSKKNLTTRSEVIDRMRRGEYDESFAEVLGWEDWQVRYFIRESEIERSVMLNPNSYMRNFIK